MLEKLTRLWSRFQTVKSNTVALQQLSLDEGPIYAVGDVHGCLSLLKTLEQLIQKDALNHNGRPKLLLLGDIIDRGPEVAPLIDHLIRPLPWADRLCLRGNHEAMMLDFIEHPHANIAWLQHGGFETLRSYGLALDPSEVRSLSERRIQQKLFAYIPEEHLTYIKNLPYGYYTQDIVDMCIFAHAGYNPHHDLLNQPLDDLIWAPQFEAHQKASDKKLIFGHFIQETIHLDRNWIGIDSGAYKTGRLTALRLCKNFTPELICTNQADR